MALLDSVVGGELLARLAVVGGLLATSLAAGRSVRDYPLSARLVCAVFAVWNPFVIERLALGQWALLLGYAGVWGCASLALPAGGGQRGAVAGPWIAVGALTPTGALLSGGAAVVLFWKAKDRWLVRILALLAQLPWAIPGVLATASAYSDPDAVAAFASRSERVGGPLWTLVGLGGIWDRSSVPLSRSGWLGHATSAIVLLSLALIAWHVVRTRRRPDPRALALVVLGALGLVLAALSTSEPGARLLEGAVMTVPGAGLLRDSQKWLAWFVVPAVLSVARAAWILQEWVARRVPALSMTVVVLVVGLPFWLLPDGTRVVWHTLSPVTYPNDFSAVAEKVEDAPGSLVALPWQTYKVFAWGNDAATYDPASRWFDIDVVGATDLVVGETVVEGEDPRSAKVSEVLSEKRRDWAPGLAALGISHVLVYGAEPDVVRSIPGADQVYDGATLELWRVQAEPTTRADVSTLAWGSLALVDAGVIVALLNAASWGSRRRRELDCC